MRSAAAAAAPSTSQSNQQQQEPQLHQEQQQQQNPPPHQHRAGSEQALLVPGLPLLSSLLSHLSAFATSFRFRIFLLLLLAWLSLVAVNFAAIIVPTTVGRRTFRLLASLVPAVDDFSFNGESFCSGLCFLLP